MIFNYTKMPFFWLSGRFMKDSEHTSSHSHMLVRELASFSAAWRFISTGSATLNSVVLLIGHLGSRLHNNRFSILYHWRRQHSTLFKLPIFVFPGYYFSFIWLSFGWEWYFKHTKVPMFFFLPLSQTVSAPSSTSAKWALIRYRQPICERNWNSCIRFVRKAW